MLRIILIMALLIAPAGCFQLGRLQVDKVIEGLIISSASAQFCSFRCPYLLDLRKVDSQKLADVMIKPESQYTWIFGK